MTNVLANLHFLTFFATPKALTFRVILAPFLKFFVIFGSIFEPLLKNMKKCKNVHFSYDILKKNEPSEASKMCQKVTNNAKKTCNRCKRCSNVQSTLHSCMCILRGVMPMTLQLLLLKIRLGVVQAPPVLLVLMSICAAEIMPPTRVPAAPNLPRS